jgi:hypothetical protein
MVEAILFLSVVAIGRTLASFELVETISWVFVFAIVSVIMIVAGFLYFLFYGWDDN